MTLIVPTTNMVALSSSFFRTAASDNAYGGYCAKGVANILQAAGLGYTRGNAHTWDETLPENGWQKVEGLTPENAPPGAVLVFDRDTNYRGKGGGAEYGHVEIVAVEADGDRKYVSDKARDNWGGSVPGNFVGVYINPKLHRPLENGDYSSTLVANNGSDVDVSPSDGPDTSPVRSPDGSTPEIFTAEERQRRALNDLLLNGQPSSNDPSTSQNFNDASNATPFMLLAIIFKALFDVDMDLAPATEEATNPTRDATTTNDVDLTETPTNRVGEQEVTTTALGSRM